MFLNTSSRMALWPLGALEKIRSMGKRLIFFALEQWV